MQAISSQILIPETTLDTYGDATLIPIDVNGRVVSRGHTVSIVELGKQLLNAARDGYTEQVRDLMGKGAPFTADWLGTSPLHFAASNNHLSTCDVLLRAGISRDGKTKVDRTPLHMAAYEGHLSIVEILIMNGADLEALDMLKMTPLHWAVQNGHADVVTFLLRKGANTDVINKFGKTPLNIAVEINRIDILQLLQVITRDPGDATDSFGIEQGSEIVELDDAASEKQQEFQPQNDSETSHCKLTETLEIPATDNSNIDLTDSLQILKEHGISFLPVDNSSVVASAVENGHSLVLTEAGKQVLNSTKNLVKLPISKVPTLKNPRLITLTADQLLAMTASSKNVFRKLPISASTPDKRIKRIVMNKNKIILSGTPNFAKKQKPESQPDIESVLRQLAEARREAEEYKQMLRRKEAEAERYKKQLLSITQGK